MTKIVILGSRRFSPYEVTFMPLEIPEISDEETRFQFSIMKSHPAMDKADVIIVYAPDGIGKHTHMDIDYAREIGKTVYQLVPLEDCKHEYRGYGSWEYGLDSEVCVLCGEET